MSFLPKFGPDAKVFAKVRGYPAWPAKIHGVDNDIPGNVKYHVCFYGTKETAICKAEEVFDYERYKHQFGQPLKRKFFNEAIIAIENDVSAPSDASTVCLDNSIAISPAVTTAIESDYSDSDGEGKLIIDESAPENSDYGSINVAGFTTGGSVNTLNRSSTTSDRSSVNDEELSELASCSDSEIASKECYESAERSEENDMDTDDCCENQDSKVPSILDSVVRDALFKSQMQLLLLDYERRIKSCLNTTRANCQECLVVLDELSQLDLTDDLLRSQPNIVLTVKKIQNYVGNVNEWNLNEEDKEKFETDAKLIRDKASQLYQDFEFLLIVDEDK